MVQSTPCVGGVSMRSDATVDDRQWNERYENDIRYTFELCNWDLKLIGIYPFVYPHANRLEKTVSTILIVICCTAMQFVIVPFSHYTLFYEKDMNLKIKFLGPLLFCVTVFIRYGYLGVKGPAIGRCIQHVETDWRLLQDRDHRNVMIKYVTMGRSLTKICAVFMCAGGLSYHTIMPLLSEKIIVGNVTIRPLTYPGYEAFFNVQETPTYEIIYCLHCFYVLVASSIMLAAYSLTAIFITHACGQIEIQTLRLESLKTERKMLAKAMDEQLAVVVRDHVRILSFARDVQETLGELFLIEVIVSTLLMCLLEYYCMMEWETSDSVAILTYFLLLLSFTFNILILCLVGELLLGQVRRNYLEITDDYFTNKILTDEYNVGGIKGSDVATASYETEWYNLPGRKARDIVLLLTTLKYPPKLTAGKVVVLSLSTFGVVLKTSVVYLNMLRTITN